MRPRRTASATVSSGPQRSRSITLVSSRLLKSKRGKLRALGKQTPSFAHCGILNNFSQTMPIKKATNVDKMPHTSNQPSFCVRKDVLLVGNEEEYENLSFDYPSPQPSLPEGISSCIFQTFAIPIKTKIFVDSTFAVPPSIY